MVARRETQHLRDQSRQRRGRVGAAVGKRDLHGHVAVGGQVQFGAENVGVGRRCQFGERFLAFVITHEPAVMLRHAEAESALESSRRAARNGISLLPSEGLRAFLQHLHRGHRFVRMARVPRREPRDVHQAVLRPGRSRRRRPSRRSCFPRTTWFPAGGSCGKARDAARWCDRRTTSIASAKLATCTSPTDWWRWSGPSACTPKSRSPMLTYTSWSIATMRPSFLAPTRNLVMVSGLICSCASS